MEKLNPLEILTQIASEQNARATEKAIKITLQAKYAAIATDKEMLSLVIFNLIDNALIHAVNASQITVEQHDNIIAVCDDGELIPTDIRENLFVRGHSALASGGGYGLYLSRFMMQRLGGRLAYQRKDSKNRFIITIGELGNTNENPHTDY